MIGAAVKRLFKGGPGRAASLAVGVAQETNPPPATHGRPPSAGPTLGSRGRTRGRVRRAGPAGHGRRAAGGSPPRQTRPAETPLSRRM